LERYTLLALTGLATHDMDDDSASTGAGPEYITTDQATQINDLIIETRSNLAAFLKYMGAEAVEKILAENYNKALIALNQKKQPRQPGAEG
jgi:hypothetical protein